MNENESGGYLLGNIFGLEECIGQKKPGKTGAMNTFVNCQSAQMYARHFLGHVSAHAAGNIVTQDMPGCERVVADN